MDKFIFGITGPTGAGKSTVSDIFRHMGVDVIDADKSARIVMQKGSKCLQELVTVFGHDILTADNELNRKKLADIVFNDSDKLKLLNSVTHKYIKDYLIKKINESDSYITAIDGAVIIGSPVMELCKKMVVVTADTDTRITRIMKRDGIDKSMAVSRINSQMSNIEYESFADYIIKNNDNNVRLEECVENIYNKIKNISGKSSA